MKDYKNMSLDSIKLELRDCFDANGKAINREKIAKILENEEVSKEVFSEDNFINAATNHSDPTLKATAEMLLGKVYRYPDTYWEMPDYYYPGLDLKRKAHTASDFSDYLPESRLKISTTKTDKLLEYCGWTRKSWDSLEYFNPAFPNTKLIFLPEEQSFSIQKYDETTNEIISETTIPFGLLCGIFLKCRELEYSKPEELSKAFDSTNYFF